ncbi:helix-turn-helix transcriptional regulator [Candidatus Woesearchaeota archaeon]|nr:helix-turn-helix transcriptional regulator [Candidatus Woesearchaeota archaeon]
MAKKNFIMLELEDKKTKKIANVVSNNSCRQILDHLADKEATETELAKTLGIPISTVHYNLQQLIETGLVIADEYHYSEKGKEVLHYKLANKYIIITPRKVTGITQKLRSILPAALITAGVAGIIQLYTYLTTGTAKILGSGMPMSAKYSAEDMVAENTAAVADEGTRLLAESATQAAPPEMIAVTGNAAPFWHNLALWFLIGALFALGVYFLISWLRKD